MHIACVDMCDNGYLHLSEQIMNQVCDNEYLYLSEQFVNQVCLPLDWDTILVHITA